MSASNDLYEAVSELLGREGALRVNVPIVQRRTKSIWDEIEAVTAKSGGLCIWIIPPIPKRAEPMGGGNIVFFSSAEIRVRIVEQPALNNAGADAYDLVDDVANALQGQPRLPGKLSSILSYPLQLAATPVDQPYDADLQDRYRIIDVIFEAVYGFTPST